jgi:hypothetical protein
MHQQHFTAQLQNLNNNNAFSTLLSDLYENYFALQPNYASSKQSTGLFLSSTARNFLAFCQMSLRYNNASFRHLPESGVLTICCD